MPKYTQIQRQHRSHEQEVVEPCVVDEQLLAERMRRIKLGEDVELCLETIDEALDPPSDG